jgi:hypothetical protein
LKRGGTEKAEDFDSREGKSLFSVAEALSTFATIYARLNAVLFCGSAGSMGRSFVGAFRHDYAALASCGRVGQNAKVVP